MQPTRLIAGLTALALSTVSSRPISAQTADVSTVIARIEAPQFPNRQGYDALTLPELMKRLRVPGVSVAVIRDYRIHWAKAYGVADVGTGRAVDTGKVFQAASISKPVFAMVRWGNYDER